MAIKVGAGALTIEDVVKVARHCEKVELAAEAVARISKCRAMLEKKIAAHEIMYGVNTGIGEFSEMVLNDEQVQQFQRYLIYNHAAGIGGPCPIEHVRAAMLSRIAVHTRGHSGCRPEITRTYVEMLNKGVTPVVCEKGSVGACGDLSPMSQVALSLMGEGESFYDGARMPTKAAMEKAGIPVPGLQARDGLAAINGSNLITGMGCLELYDSERWVKQAEITAAMTLEALMANMKPYDTRLHELRGFKGAITSAANIRSVVDGSDLITGKLKVKVQDAYSMRSTPQVIGAFRDHLAYARKQFEIELNGVADNPIFLPDSNTVLTGANFQGTPISMPLDMVGAGVTMVSVLSERRLNRLLNPALSVGLPAFLTKGAGMFSGHMLSQYTADMLIVEQRILSAPSCVQSIPAAADQEDFVSMGMNAALKTRQILNNAEGVLAIEMIAAAQGIDFREFSVGKGTRAAHGAVRKIVEHLEVDRPLFKGHNAVSDAVKRCDVLEAVEKEIGELKSSW
ncbi:MAG: phenylalanine ammonia-lyase [Elusimicrobia bacterium CG08_land_8_20_14_0_20_59_10]|nr:MAG: phenylalanine ammonia-lyase [Elusimicrobia bacterium CG08_land_8_20_14_0_20_59_10]